MAGTTDYIPWAKCGPQNQSLRPAKKVLAAIYLFKPLVVKTYNYSLNSINTVY